MTTDGPTSRGPPPLRLRRAPRSACKRLAAPRPKAPAGQASVVQERTGGRSCRGDSAGRRARSQQGGAGPAASGTGRKGRGAPRSARSRPCPGADPSPASPWMNASPADVPPGPPRTREHGRTGAREDGRTGGWAPSTAWRPRGKPWPARAAGPRTHCCVGPSARRSGRSCSNGRETRAPSVGSFLAAGA